MKNKKLVEMANDYAASMVGEEDVNYSAYYDAFIEGYLTKENDEH